MTNTGAAGAGKSMQALRLLFSPSGKLSPQAFAIAAAAVYGVGAASHLLTVPSVTARAGLWPFMVAQALLIWTWFALHARRLHDAGRAATPAAGIGLLYALSVVLLVLVVVSFALAGPDAVTATARGLILLAMIFGALVGSREYDFTWLMAAGLTAMAVVPVVVAIVFSFWTATRPSIESPAA